VRRVAIIASASGNGKTTLGRHLARELGVPFVELDALIQQRVRRREWPRALARYPVVRLRSQAEIEQVLARVLR
jgi:shikimate kinase